jgi:signal peptidase II
LKRVHYLALSAAVIILDIWTKFLVLKNIDLHEAIPVIPSFFQLVHVRNTGAAFGIGANAANSIVPLLLNLGAIAVFCVVVVYAFRSAITDRLLQTGLHLILGGAIGNLLDRFRFGYVVDFLDVYVGRHHWPAFNVADSAICIGIALLFFDMKKKPETADADDAVRAAT